MSVHKYLCPECKGTGETVANQHRSEPWMHHDAPCSCDDGLIITDQSRHDLRPWSPERERGFNRWALAFRPVPADPLVTLERARREHDRYPSTYRVARFTALQDYAVGRLP